MLYEVRVRPAARKSLDRLQHPDYQAVARAINGLERNPRPPRVKKLRDSGLWRLRVGSLRIVYAVDDGARTVTVARIARRNEGTYRGL